MAEKINFTKTILDAVKCPAGKDRMYTYDVKTPGLTMLVTATGAKSFYLYKKFNGRPERIRLGTYPDMTPEQARAAATRAAGQFARGINPRIRRESAEK